jgi:hypothetical protein
MMAMDAGAFVAAVRRAGQKKKKAIPVPKSFTTPGPTRARAKQKARIVKGQKAKNPVGGGLPRPKSRTNPFGLPGLGVGPGPKGRKNPPRAKTTTKSAPRPTGTSGSARSGGTAPSAGASRPAAASSGGGVGGGASAGSNPGGGGGGGGGGRSSRSSRSSRTTKTTAPPAAGNDPLALPEWDSDRIFGAARRELDRQRQMAQARYNLQQRDLNSFNEWLAGKQQTSEAALQQANQGYLDSAAQARQQAAEKLNALTQGALATLGGHQGLAAASGVTAQTEAAAAQQGGLDATQQYLADMAKADQTQLANQREVNAARAARLISENSSAFNKANEDITKAGSDLETQAGLEEFKYNADRVKADRQYNLDKDAASWLQGFREKELAANTQVQIAKSKADTLAAQLDAQIEAGKLDLRAAELRIKQADLTRKEKADAARILRERRNEIRGARQDRRANRAKADSQVDTFIGAAVKGYGKNNLSDLDRHNYGQVAHRTIAMLGGAYPNLTKAEVVQMISSRFGSEVATDERILRDIDARFRR